MRHRFVYYRVAERDVAAAAAVVRDAQARASACWPGLACELMRAEGADAQGRITLMEAYSAGGALPQAWQDIERELHDSVAPWLLGERHVEDFRPCA